MNATRGFTLSHLALAVLVALRGFGATGKISFA